MEFINYSFNLSLILILLKIFYRLILSSIPFYQPILLIMITIDFTLELSFLFTDYSMSDINSFIVAAQFTFLIEIFAPKKNVD